MSMVFVDGQAIEWFDHYVQMQEICARSKDGWIGCWSLNEEVMRIQGYNIYVTAYTVKKNVSLTFICNRCKAIPEGAVSIEATLYSKQRGRKSVDRIISLEPVPNLETGWRALVKLAPSDFQEYYDDYRLGLL